MEQPVTIDPLVPPGSESLRFGDDHIRDLAKWILMLMGFTGTNQQVVDAPFNVNGVSPANGLGTGVVEVYHDPTTPFGIATQQFVGRKVLYANVVLSGVEYAGNTVPATVSPTGGFQYDINAIYIISPNVANSGGGVMLRLNTGPSVPFVHLDGTPLVAGELTPFSSNVAVFDGAGFRLQTFGGGNVPGPATFTTGASVAANPTTDLGLAPKQYVDSAVGHPANTALPADTASFGNTATTILSTTATTPNDGNTYLLHVEYWMWVVRDSGAILQAQTWIDANGETFAMGGARLDGTQIVGSTNGSGICSIVVPANTAVTVTMKGISSGGNIHASPAGSGFPGTPASALRVTLLRTTP